MGIKNTYPSELLSDLPKGCWPLNDSEGYAQAVLSDNPAGYWRMDAASGTTETDRASSPANGTYNGGFTLNQSGALSDGDKAAAFNGSTGYLSVADVAALRPGAGDFSIELWFRRSGNPAGYETLVAKPGGGTSDSYNIDIPAGTNTLRASIGSKNVPDTTVTLDGSWHHVVLVRSGSTGKLYLDGSLANSVASATDTLNNTGALTFAARLGGASQFLNGSIDEGAYYSYALSAQQVANHYALRTSTITTVAAMTVPDTTGNGYTGTVKGGLVFGQTTPQPSGRGALFNGGTPTNGGQSYIDMGNVAALAFTTAFSVEAWFKASASGSGSNRYLVSKALRNNDQGWEFFVADDGTGFIGLVSYQAAGPVCFDVRTTVTNFLDGNWHQAVATWDGTTGANGVKIYTDGALKRQGTASNAPETNSQPYRIGSVGNFVDANIWNGSMANVAVWGRALSAQEVADHYAAISLTLNQRPA